jgi:1,4-alpha-glucan branching enzyme
VGDFNRWSPTALPMKRSADGRTWEIDVKLPQGRYNYTYLIDGRIARDPSAPQTGGGGDDFGMPNSVLMVSGT